VLEIHDTIQGFRAALDAERAAGRVVGLVPTMGYLHAGHASLLRRSAQECEVTALTIFVNPLQFAVGEDLDAYPRPLSRDLELAESAGASVAFTPSTDEMYPRPTATNVHVEGLTASLEGASRPTHFDGVTTVVTKLFNVAGPCRAYFGEKDFQQLSVVRRMAADLDQPVTVVGCPIVREPDGLALSSRNVYLSPEQRTAAAVLNRALRAGAALVEQGERVPSAVAARMAEVVAAEPLALLDYAELVDPDTLEPPVALESGRSVQLLVAAGLGQTRLLDNLAVLVP
jgi:pantoate--beta-alanine ligase